VVVSAATQREANLLLDLDAPWRPLDGPFPAWQSGAITVVRTGVGKSAAAAGTTWAVMHARSAQANPSFTARATGGGDHAAHASAPVWVLSIGIAGSFDTDRMPVGSAWCAVSESFADEGATNAEGRFAPFAVLGPAGDRGGTEAFAAASPPIGFALSRWPSHWFGDAGAYVSGPGITVSHVTSSAAEAAAREPHLLYMLQSMSRTDAGPIGESMEGAAVALAAYALRAWCTELRGISNGVGPRDTSAWRASEALAAIRPFVASLVRWSRDA
jgi:futalosine hydrolase